MPIKNTRTVSANRNGTLLLHDKTFIALYVSNGFNGMAAYRELHKNITPQAADYGSRKILDKHCVQRYLQELVEKNINKLMLNRDQTAQLLTSIILADPCKFIENNEMRKFISTIPYSERLAITKIKFDNIVDKDGKLTTVISDITWANKTEALHIMAKILHMVQDTTQQTTINADNVYQLVLPPSPHDPQSVQAVAQAVLTDPVIPKQLNSPVK